MLSHPTPSMEPHFHASFNGDKKKPSALVVDYPISYLDDFSNLDHTYWRTSHNYSEMFYFLQTCWQENLEMVPPQ